MNDRPSIGYLMNWNAKLLRRLADRRLAPLGLSSGHFPVLVALMRHGSLSQKELTELAAIEQPTMAATLIRMERDGIVERRPDANDRRSYRFSFTSETRAKLPALERIIDGLNEAALAGLSDDDRVRFRAMLQTTIESLEQAVDQGGEGREQRR